MESVLSCIVLALLSCSDVLYNRNKFFWMQIEQLADAAEMNDIEKVKKLIKSGISVNSTNKVRHV